MHMRITSTSQHHPAHRQRRNLHLSLGTQRFLAVFEGLEGGFAISTSIVAGLYFANMPQHILVTTIVVSVLVNGFNAASVKYSSEHYLDELDGREKRSPFRHYFIPALIEFLVYLTISMTTLVPLLLIPNTALAIGALTLSNLSILFAAGWWRGYMVRLHPWRDAFETCLLGAGIIAVGAIAGWLLYSI